MTEPRGIRNRNPFNIRQSDAPWVGKVHPSTDSDFEQFVTPDFGIRAGLKILLNYQNLHQLRTITSIISRWAPDNENDTAAYIKFVSGKVHRDPMEILDLHDPVTLAELGLAIICQENGQCPYPWEIILGQAMNVTHKDKPAEVAV